LARRFSATSAIRNVVHTIVDQSTSKVVSKQSDTHAQRTPENHLPEEGKLSLTETESLLRQMKLMETHYRSLLKVQDKLLKERTPD
jgi:hypothetical protein